MKVLRVSRDATEDLIEIFAYIARDDTDAADRFCQRLEDLIRTIANQPKIGRIRNDLDASVRSIAAENYVVYYRYERGIVRILRVLHGARDVREIW